MKVKSLLAFVSVVSLVAVNAAVAASKHSSRHARHAPRGPAIVTTVPAYAPARMIEVRPGIFISSYDCYTDEGYGRLRSCSAGGRDDR